MKTIYLCGPINGCSDDEATTWRERVKAYLRTGGRAWTRDPMDRDYRGHEAAAYREIVELDKRDVRESDAVLVNYSKPSIGTAMEILYAWEIGKPVVLWVDLADADLAPLSPWLRYHSTTIVYTFEDAMRAVARITGEPVGVGARLETEQAVELLRMQLDRKRGARITRRK